MLIDFDFICKKYEIPSGIIHIGSHLLEERNSYLSNGVSNIIWIEANTQIYNSTKYLINKKINENIFNYAICDKDNEVLELNITNNGQSSSILDLDKHKIYYPNIDVVSKINIESKRMDSLIKENLIDINNYNFVNIDIQGAELLALKGFGDILHNIKYIYTEINISYLYKNCCLVNEIDDYLNKYGFTRVETKLTEYEWGDALYAK
jgi:FkbM family methyltransferase